MLILAPGSGCKKSASEGGNPQSQTANTQTLIAARQSLSTNASPVLARVHWLGKKRIAAQKTSSYFMSMWNMSEAARLEAQTLDKLALAMGNASQTASAGVQPPATNNLSLATNYLALVAGHPAAALLRPLLDDLVREESYLEVQQQADQQAEIVLAIRLEDPRADLWVSNVSAVVTAMNGIQSLPAPASRLAWRLAPGVAPTRQDGKDATNRTDTAAAATLSSRPLTIQMARVGEWTLLGVATETNGLLAELSHRTLLDHTPVVAPGNTSSFQMDPVTRKVGPAPVSVAATNQWLETDFDLRRLSSALSLGWHLPGAWPRIAATWAGNGDLVRTTGTLTFDTPLNLQLEPWNFPTNLIHQPLVGFTALRGVRPWLARQKWLQQFQIEPLPDQFCTWASGPTPLLSFAATPMPNAASLLQKVGPRAQAELNPWVTSNAIGELQFTNEPAALAWSGIPMFTPMIEGTTTPVGDFLLLGVGAKPTGPGNSAPPELFAQLMARPNLVYYDWEISQFKLAHWVYLGQTARLALVLPQMEPESAAFAFLLAVAPKLGNTGTEIIQDGPARLGFVRNSQSGFTGFELHLLADWLESPAFPRGLYCLLAPRPSKPLIHRPGTNSIPSIPSPAQHRINSVVPPH